MSGMQQERRSGCGDECRNAWSRLENENQAAGSERKVEKKEVRGEILVYQENRIFQKSHLRTGVRKLSRTGLVPARAWGGQTVGIAPAERLKLRRQIAAAAGWKESVGRK